jgi:hypothetical protein
MGSTPPLYSTVWNGYSTTMQQASSLAAHDLIVAFAPELAGAVAIVIITIGCFTLLGSITLARFWGYLARTIAITNLISTPLYTFWVMTMFLVTIPQKIAAALGQGSGGLTVAQQLDLLQSALDKMEAALLAAVGVLNVADRINIGWSETVGSFMLLGCLVVSLIAMAMTAVVLPAGAVMLIFYFFEKTQHIAERWITKLISLMVLQLFISILMQIVQTQMMGYMRMAETSAATGLNFDEQLNLFWTVSESFGIGFLLLLCLPTLATVVGGSTVSNMVLMPMTFISSGGLRAAGRSAAGGATRMARSLGRT